MAVIHMVLLATVLQTGPASISGHMGAVHGRLVYVTGGMGLANAGSFYRTLWEVDPARGTWRALPEMRTARAMAAGAILGESIFVAGGMDWSGEALASVERFDLRSGRWEDAAHLRTGRSRLALVSMNGKLYAVSGMRGQRRGQESLNTASIEEYDPAGAVWKEVGALNHARHGFASAVWNNRLYVFGGNDAETERSCEAWDPGTGKSIDLPAMPVGRGFEGIVEYEGRLILFGGRSSVSHPSSFDPEITTWANIPAPDIDINRCVSLVLDGKLWTIGGEGREPIPVIQSFDLSGWSKRRGAPGKCDGR